jgi:hypothetical protein
MKAPIFVVGFLKIKFRVYGNMEFLVDVGLLGSNTAYVVTNVSEENSASIFRVGDSSSV